ncbi:PREDICTED: matrix metalloproteinase-2-like [Trachymyrmex cornetzi]|uniref:matrix metalloproteinase-2-like n=1 Tax=Trachymyrmex cornetzi TaxID=471704 RepID=UPI00084ED99D|nr:PREDICTED: matrix metalloproteinase-2-like [Trachymyrmex cornetzi]
MSLTFIIVIVFITITTTTTRTTASTTTTNRESIDTEVNLYLQKYGYLSKAGNNTQLSFEEGELKQAISLFQEYYQIQGEMLADPHTLQTTEFAFSLWAANSSLSFERKTVNPDILISYRNGTHTYADRRRNEEICASSLDGPGGVLAHAFCPPTVDSYSAEIHIDSAEPWHIYLTDKSASSNKDYLLNTLIHEIGHALGLMHSSCEESIMFAVVTARNNNRIAKLNIEDILAIQHNFMELKIQNQQQPPTTESTTNTPTYVDLCTLQYVDTVLDVEDIDNIGNIDDDEYLSDDSGYCSN